MIQPHAHIYRTRGLGSEPLDTTIHSCWGNRFDLSLLVITLAYAWALRRLRLTGPLALADRIAPAQEPRLALVWMILTHQQPRSAAAHPRAAALHARLA